MSMLTRPAPMRDRLLQILQTAASPLTTAEVAARINRSTNSTSSQLSKMRAYGYIDSVKPSPSPPRSPSSISWIVRERR